MTKYLLALTLVILALIYFGQRYHKKAVLWLAFGIFLLIVGFACWLFFGLIPAM